MLKPLLGTNFCMISSMIIPAIMVLCKYNISNENKSEVESYVTSQQGAETGSLLCVPYKEGEQAKTLSAMANKALINSYISSCKVEK